MKWIYLCFVSGMLWRGGGGGMRTKVTQIKKRLVDRSRNRLVETLCYSLGRRFKIWARNVNKNDSDLTKFTHVVNRRGGRGISELMTFPLIIILESM